MSPTPVHATHADVDAAAAVLTASFLDDPVQRWIFGEVDDYAGAVRALFDVFVPEYFAIGHTFVVHGPGGVSGAALWAPPDRHILQGDAVQVLFERLGPFLGDQLVPRLSEVSRVDEFRPAEPHLYLGILGVDPGAQSSGLGTALVAPVLAECDRMGLLAHLESSNPRNIPFYRRHGFEVTDEFRLGGDGALMTMMSRPPAGN